MANILASMCSRVFLRRPSTVFSHSFKTSIPALTKCTKSRAFSSFSTVDNTTEKKGEQSPPPSGEPSGESSGSKTEEKPSSEIENLHDRIRELNDKYLRTLAETENMRNRFQRQITEAKRYGIQSFCKDLLEVADILAKATESIPESELNDGNPHLKNLYEGLKMTEAQLHKVFRVHGVTQINPIGDKFDPNIHEALFEQEFEGKPPGTVAIVTKIGYKLHDRTIRPAVVGVVKAS